PDFHVAMATAGYYRMDSAHAGRIVNDVFDVVKKWEVRARRLGLSGQECSDADHLFCCEN
ncbi:MAG: type II toxin-antitoxin system HipA family toxin, partial [Chlorobium sp.]